MNAETYWHTKIYRIISSKIIQIIDFNKNVCVCVCVWCLQEKVPKKVRKGGILWSLSGVCEDRKAIKVSKSSSKSQACWHHFRIRLSWVLIYICEFRVWFQKECALFVQMIEPWFWFNPWGGEMHDSPWRSPDTLHKMLRSKRELLVRETPEHHVACWIFLTLIHQSKNMREKIHV